MEQNRNKWFTHEINEITFFVIFGLLMTIIIPVVFGFVFGGFEESFVSGRPLQFGDILTNYLLYWILIIVALIGLPMLKIREMYLTKRGEHHSSQKNPRLMGVAYLHDPEQDGLLYSMSNELGLKKNYMRWSLSMLRMFIIFTLIFGGIGIVQTITNFSFVGIPQMPFQLTSFGKVFFSAEPPAFAETMMAIFIFSLLMGIVGYLTSKYKFGKMGYFSIGFVVCSMMAILWMGYHSIVYSNSESALIATLIFGFFGSMLTLLFGSWIPWYTWHFWNNFFVKLAEVVTIREDIILVGIVVWFVLLVLYISGEYLVSKIKKKEVL